MYIGQAVCHVKDHNCFDILTLSKQTKYLNLRFMRKM